MSEEDQYLNSLLENAKISSNEPAMIPLPSLEPPKQPKPQQMYEKNPYTGEMIPVRPEQNPYQKPTVPMSRELSPEEKIKLLGGMVANTYKQALHIERDHDNNESYGSTDRGMRASMMSGLQKMAVNLDKQAIAAKQGKQITLTNTMVEEITPNVPQFVNINQTTPNTNIPQQIQQPQIPYINRPQHNDDNQLELDFTGGSINDVLNECAKMCSKLNDLEYNIKEINNKINKLISDQTIKKK